MPVANRKVTHARKDANGRITALCNPAARWSPRATPHVAVDIELRIHTYYVDLDGGQPAPVIVFAKDGRKVLQTALDTDEVSVLDSLPAC